MGIKTPCPCHIVRNFFITSLAKRVQPCFRAQNCGLLQMLFKNLWYNHLWYACFKSKCLTAWNLHPFQTYFWWVRTHLVKKPSPDKTIFEQIPQNNYLGLSKEIICLFLIYGSPILGEIPTQPPLPQYEAYGFVLKTFSHKKSLRKNNHSSLFTLVMSLFFNFMHPLPM